MSNKTTVGCPGCGITLAPHGPECLARKPDPYDGVVTPGMRRVASPVARRADAASQDAEHIKCAAAQCPEPFGCPGGTVCEPVPDYDACAADLARSEERTAELEAAVETVRRLHAAAAKERRSQPFGSVFAAALDNQISAFALALQAFEAKS